MFGGRLRLLLVIIAWVVSILALVLWLIGGQNDRIIIASAPQGSESHEMGAAIARVLTQADNRMQVEDIETGGTRVNLRLLQEGLVDLATLQGDTPVPEGIKAVAVLFQDAYHLIVREESGIRHFSDLQGKRVAVPPKSSAQNGSFWFLAHHYGLSADDIDTQPMAEAAANFAMKHGGIDAVFRVRAPGNQGVHDLIGDQGMVIIPIRQADALTLKQHALRRGVIPRGSYRGYPPLPAEDLPTAGLDRVLVTRADVPAELIYRVTRDLFEHRSDIAGYSKLAGMIGPLPDDADGTVPAHPGARRYYDREKPGLVQQNARLASALLYTVVILCSAMVALRTHWLRSRRIRMGDFNKRLMEIADAARDNDNNAELMQAKLTLMDILGEVVGDLDREKVSQEEFEHFSFTWQAVDALVRDRLILTGMLGTSPAPQGGA